MKISDSAPQSQIYASGRENHQVAFGGQQHFRSTSNSPYGKSEFELILFDDDDTILSDTHMEAHAGIIAHNSFHLDDYIMFEPEFQPVTFDIEESPMVESDHVPLVIDFEKFTFEHVS